MENDFSPSFDVHRDWIERLVKDTPTPLKSSNLASTALLTADDSPTEHVLRGSKSFAIRSFRSRASGNSLRVPSSNKENRSTNDAENSRTSSGQHASSTGPVLGEIAPNGQIVRPPGPWKFRPSPTPSLKKKKAEAIVKAHGSPQHVRVTAGGRIVPSEQSPLCHPRYGYSAIKTNGGLIKFAPNHPMGKAQWTEATQNGFVAQDVNGRLCQIVNGTILPLNEVDGALRLYVPAPNLNITSRGSSFGPSAQGRLASNGNQQRATSQNKPMVPADPPIPAQTNALELEYSKLEHELKELDKTEVLHGRTMGKAAKDALIGKRRELVVTLDNIRKAIKSIKAAPPLEAPTSPRAMQKQQSTSPPRNRLPAFLQQRVHQNRDMTMPPGAPPFGPFFGMAQPPPFNGQYGFQPTPSPDESYNQTFGMPPHALFVPPPPFDGSMAQPFLPYSDPATNAITGPPELQPSAPAGRPESSNVDASLPQTDGTRSFADLRKVRSPRQSRALDIKAPEPRPATALKSNLNPMSPAYKPGAGVLKASDNANRPAPKPVKDRVPTPLSPLHQLRPAAAANKGSRATDDTSPAKKSPHLHSSSISSFETADFFPRNTREYSTRKFAYPEQSDEDKENIIPHYSGHKHQGSPTTPISDGLNSEASKGNPAPAPPAGTPVARDAPASKPQLPINITSMDPESHRIDFGAVPDRHTHNISPKGRRQDLLFVEEHPSQYGSQASSSPEKFQSCREKPCMTSSPAENIDFTEASSDWIEGYRSGLARKTVRSDRMGEFLDGYCAGLLKSKTTANIGPSTGSPVKSISRRPSPAVVRSRSSSQVQTERREPVAARPPFETNFQSMDTLKEAVLAPQNENAILTPSADGPHANEHQFNLGVWGRTHEPATSVESLASTRGDGLASFPFPYRTSSTLKRQDMMSENKITAYPHGQGTNAGTAEHVPTDVSGRQHLQSLSSTATGLTSINPSSSYNPSNRVSSMTSIDSNIYRQWPGHRVFSPHLEWKSASSIAQAAGLAAGHFASTQFDGAYQRLHRYASITADMFTSTGTTQPQRQTSIMGSNPVMENHSRFKEGSLDGITNPPNSPQLVSPPTSPSLPAKDSPSKESKKRDSPGKGASPAKVKFERIAEKVGIQVSVGKKEEGSSPNSPPSKRRWRDVWRGGARKETSKDEGTPPTFT